MTKTGNIFKLFLFLIILFFSAGTLFAQEVQVYAQVEMQEMYMGESFIYQISVEGKKPAEGPQLAGFENFNVTYRGIYPEKSMSVAFQNGKQVVIEKNTYKYQWNLSPIKTGTLVIPAVMVKVEGRNFMTDAITVTVRKPTDAEYYKLRLHLNRTTCYIGEKTTVTVTWYISQKANGPVDFNIPLFNDNRFDVLSPSEPIGPGIEYFTVVIGNEQVNLIQGKGSLGGQSYTTYSFKKVLVPKKAGIIRVPAATVSFNGVTGGRQKRDIWGNLALNKIVIPSNELSITVAALPATGKPGNFSGLIGNYSIDARAAPVSVRVGDPITLTIDLKGDGYLEDAELPPLHEMPELYRDFKIPRDMAPGEVEGNTVEFLQTLRALNDQVTQIPAIKIPFFNVKTGKYDIIVTKPIPITVEPATSELSVLDMEGKDPIELQREIEIREEGIAHNYEGYDVVRNQAYGLSYFFGNSGLLFLIILPMITYLVLLYIFRFSPLVKGDRSALLTRKAFVLLEDTLKTGITAKPDTGGTKLEFLDKVMEELRKYLGAKLKTNAGSITFKDIEKPLITHGISKETVKQLEKIFNTCEAGHYAGGAFLQEDLSELCRNTRDIVTDIERSFT